MVGSTNGPSLSIPPAEAPAHEAPPPTAASAGTARPITPRGGDGYRLGIANGALFFAGDALIDPTTVIAVFVSGLTASSSLVGLAASLSDLGWFLPQFAVVPWVARRPHHLGVYRGAAVVRAGALAVLAAAIIPLSVVPGALLGVFLLCYGAYCGGAGFAGVSFMEVVGKTVARERLSAFFAQRMFWGGLLAALAGLVVRQVLRGAPGPLDYALLFAAAAVITGIAYATFMRIREPEGAAGHSASTPLGMLRHGLALLRGSPSFRRFLLARAALPLWTASSPFVLLFAVRDMAGGTRVTGTFLFARMAGMVVSNLAWQPLSRRHGSRWLLRLATFGLMALPAGAALIAWLSPGGLRLVPAGGAVAALEGLAFCGGALQSAMLIAYGSLMIELAPEGERQSFIGLLNSFLGLTLFLPALAGWLVDRIGAAPVFALAALGAVPCHLAARRLLASAAPAILAGHSPPRHPR